MSSPPTAAQQRRLLDWFGRNRRDLPWRRKPTPYRVWVSEVMLQQTTVTTVLPYYRAFLRRFPSMRALAEADIDTVLAAWSGLGYYQRARNLHRGARRIVEQHAGRFPRSLEAALQVPGVGLYTASAVLSICHGAAHAVVDGNVKRVLSRQLALRGAAWDKDAAYYNLAGDWLERQAPGDWNQALMELGATICTPRSPKCEACPVRRWCQAFALGIQERLPESKRRRPTIDVTVAAALIEERGRILLVRRLKGKLLSRMWELPQSSLESRGLPDLERDLREAHELEIEPLQLLVRARHAITFRRIKLEGYRARLKQPIPSDPERFCWIRPAELSQVAVSSSTRKLIEGTRKSQLTLPL